MSGPAVQEEEPKEADSLWVHFVAPNKDLFEAYEKVLL